MKTIKEMIEQRVRALNVMRDLQKRADDEHRTMATDEKEQWDKANAEFDSLTEDIQRAEAMKEKETMLAGEETRSRKVTESKPVELDYRKVFDKYARWGITSLDSEERSLMASNLNVETRGTSPQTTAVAAGGYTVPEDFSKELEVAMAEWGGMLQAARVVQTTTGATLPWPTVDDTSAVGVLQTEGTAITVNDMTFSEVSYTAYTLGTLVEVSLQLLQDTGVPLEMVLGDLLARRLGTQFNAYFTTGTGSSQPTGIMAASGGTSAGVTAGATTITRENLLNLYHSVDPAYRRSPKCYWMMNDSTLSYIRALTIGSADDRPLWQPSMREGVPDTIEGKPYIINQDLASVGTGNKSMAFGDFSKYIIRTVGGVNLRRLDERYAEKLNVGFVAWQRADGKLLQTAAIKHLVHS